jgi:uncharacterized protein (DUF433 family)
MGALLPDPVGIGRIPYQSNKVTTFSKEASMRESARRRQISLIDAIRFFFSAKKPVTTGAGKGHTFFKREYGTIERKLREEKQMIEHPRIERDPEILSGKPVIKGTRMSVELILERLADRRTIEDMLDDYPFLTEEDIYAAIEYAADVLHEATRNERAAS